MGNIYFLVFFTILAASVTSGFGNGGPIKYNKFGCQSFTSIVNSLSPCKCTIHDLGKLTIYCRAEHDEHIDIPDVGATFKEFARTAYNGNVQLFKEMQLVNTSLLTLPPGLSLSFSFESIYLADNADLDFIYLEAFSDQTYNLLSSLEIINSPKLGQITGHIFKFVKEFKSLTYLTLAGLDLTYIPSAFFATYRPMTRLDLSRNHFKLTERLNFAGLSTVNYLILKDIGLTNEKLQFIPFDQLTFMSELDLQDNPLNFLDESIFKPLLVDRPRQLTLSVGQTRPCVYDFDLDIMPCKYPPVMSCDERADWICQNRLEINQENLIGFECPGESIWEYCEKKFPVLAESRY